MFYNPFRMNSKIKSILILILLISAPGWITSQVKDAGLWFAAEGELQLSKRTSMILNGEVRMKDNMMQVGTMLAELGLEYEFNLKWRLATYYRFISRHRPDQSFQYRHRYYADLRYRHRAGRHDWVARVRFQQQFRYEELWSINLADDRSYLRPKLSYRYRLNRTWRPFLAAEFYFPVTIRGVHHSDKMRFTAGTRYRINKQHSLSLYYMIQHEVRVKNPVTDYVLGIGYAFSLDN
jgi:hypothetical protein